jgi:hypothetical protein
MLNTSNRMQQSSFYGGLSILPPVYPHIHLKQRIDSTERANSAKDHSSFAIQISLDQLLSARFTFHLLVLKFRQVPLCINHINDKLFCN